MKKTPEIIAEAIAEASRPMVDRVGALENYWDLLPDLDKFRLHREAGIATKPAFVRHCMTALAEHRISRAQQASRDFHKLFGPTA